MANYSLSGRRRTVERTMRRYKDFVNLKISVYFRELHKGRRAVVYRGECARVVSACVSKIEM